MKTLILPLLMNTLATLPLFPQQPPTNWMGPAKHCGGQQVSTRWMMDLVTDDVEVYLSPEKVLVLVDREPIITTEDNEAFLKAGIFGMAGTRLALMGEVEFIDDRLLHGRYAGTLDGQQVVMDQYLRVRNDVPGLLVRMVRNAQGPAQMAAYADLAFVRFLFKDVAVEPGPVLTQQ